MRDRSWWDNRWDRNATINYYDGSTILNAEERAVTLQFWKATSGTPNVKGRHSSVHVFERVPHLVASLESLVAQGYTATDISPMFGVARSTVARWCRAAGIKLKVHTPSRVWCDLHGCFVPILARRGTRLRVRDANPRRRPTARQIAILRASAPNRGRTVTHCLRGHVLGNTGPRNSAGSCGICARACQQKRYRGSPDTPCGLCGAILIGPHGLKLHLTRWCPKRSS